MKKKLLFIIGTRPELIKVFPLINYLKTINYTLFKVVSTGQHKDLLESYWNIFNIKPDYQLDIIKAGQNLIQLTSRAIIAIDQLLLDIEPTFKPDIIIAQGDTTTVMASSMVAFYNNIKFAHIEAGLRSFDMRHPFPEEFNRKIAGITADFHFAPTLTSKNNLLKENISETKIHVVGNTVIDTIQYFINSKALLNHTFLNPKLKNVSKNCILITCHRRENHFAIDDLISVINQLSIDNPKLTFIWPVHPNPNVKNKVLNSGLDKNQNVIITDPLEYLDSIKVISISKKVISDSGGIQEEAPTFIVPVLILRETTERPEGIEMGFSKLVGMNKELILDAFYNFSPDFVDEALNPYGDGKSSERIIKILIQ